MIMDLPLAGILSVVASYFAKAGIVGLVMGIITRVLNIWIRAWMGKEDIL